MVAYSFRKTFKAPIRLGLTDPASPFAKLQTIRGHRKRHARVGEPIQLYSGMRTKYCEKIIPDPICTGVVDDLHIWVGSSCIDRIYRNGHSLMPSSFDLFAQRDGFADASAMHEFWHREHGIGEFKGVMILWTPVLADTAGAGIAA